MGNIMQNKTTCLLLISIWVRLKVMQVIKKNSLIRHRDAINNIFYNHEEHEDNKGRAVEPMTQKLYSARFSKWH